MSILDKEDTYSADVTWGFPHTHHWLALGYCIANSKCAWNLEVNLHVNVQMLVQGLQDCKTPPAYTIKSIFLGRYGTKVDEKLLTQAPLYFTSHIESIHISNSGHILTDCIKVVSKAISSPKTMNMVGSKFILQSMEVLASMLQQSRGH